MSDKPTIVQADTFAAHTDLMDDEALVRYRQVVRESRGHDMAPINHNSLRRLIARIDVAEAALHRTRASSGEVESSTDVSRDLLAIGPRPEGKVLAWADPRPCFYKNSIGECGHCAGCRQRAIRAGALSDAPAEGGA